ncbi:hypothetical protein B0H11DRAFT_1919493 [Mycena galericulata]|nr:hypothetical protein B0H11DRAFT_1919493 [Mycena galericulata]
MHRGLRILEIADMICAQAGAEGLLPLPKGSARDLSALARTCTTLCNPALDVLWRSKDTIVNLLRCMPSDLWEINADKDVYGLQDIRLQRPIIHADWERAQFYLPPKGPTVPLRQDLLGTFSSSSERRRRNGRGYVKLSNKGKLLARLSCGCRADGVASPDMFPRVYFVAASFARL